MKSHTVVILTICSCLVFVSNSSAQAWEQYFPTEDISEIKHLNDKLQAITCGVSFNQTFHFLNPLNGEIDSTFSFSNCNENTLFDGGTIEANNVTPNSDSSDIEIIKKDLNGNTEWTTIYGDSLSHFIFDAIQIQDSNFIVALKSSENQWSNWPAKIRLIKLNNEGGILWDKVYYTPYQNSWVFSGLSSSKIDGSFYVHHSIPTSIFTSEAHFKVLEKNGSQRFMKTLSASDNGTTSINNISSTIWGGTIVSGTHVIGSGPSTSYNSFQYKYDEHGNETNNPKYAPVGIELDDGGSIYCQNTNGSFDLIQVNTHGDELSKINFEGYATHIEKGDGNRFYIAGKKNGQGYIMAYEPNIITENEHFICYGNDFFGTPIYSDTTIIDTIPLTDYDSIIFQNIFVKDHYDKLFDENICDGDSILFAGQYYFEEGTYIDSLISYYGCDSISTLALNVLPNSFSTVDTSIIYGNTFLDIPIFSDTTIIQNLIAKNGCDSTVTTHISILTSVENKLKKSLNLNIFPNPTADIFSIEMDLPQAMELNIEVVDMLSRRVAVISENELFQKGRQNIKVDASEWPSGIYLLQFQSDGISFSKKIIKK